MNPDCTPRTRSVWPSLRVKIAHQKVGVNRHFQAAEPHSPKDACSSSFLDSAEQVKQNFRQIFCQIWCKILLLLAFMNAAFLVIAFPKVVVNEHGSPPLLSSSSPFFYFLIPFLSLFLEPHPTEPVTGAGDMGQRPRWQTIWNGWSSGAMPHWCIFHLKKSSSVGNRFCGCS